MDLRLISLNVNSIVNYGRKYMLNEFIARNPAHIYFVQETKFGPRHSYSFPSFSSFTSSHSAGCGGAMLLVHCGMKIRNLRTIMGTIDGVFVDIFVNDCWITFGSVYVNPMCTDLGQLSGLLTGTNHFVIGSDFNARDPSFGDVSANGLGRLMANWAAFDCCTIVNSPSPTCYRSVSGSFIDKFVLDANPMFSFSAVSTIQSFSDHSGISLTIHCPTFDLSIRNGFLLKQYDKVNVVRMNRFLEREFDALEIPTDTNLPPGDLETMAEMTNDILTRTIDRFVPTTFIRSNGVLLSGTTRAALRTYHSRQRRLHRCVRNGAWLPEVNRIRGEVQMLRQMVLNGVGHDLGNHYRNNMANTTSMRDAYRTVRTNTGYRRRTTCPAMIYADEAKTDSLIGPGAIANGFLRRFSENHQLTIDNFSDADVVVSQYCARLAEDDIVIGFGA